MLTQAYLKRALNYDPISGLFTRFKSVGNAKAGSVAGSINSDGYPQIMVDGVRYKAHRLAFLYMTGSFPDQVDHINGIRNDNKWINLRAVTLSDNAKNKKTPKNNTSGMAGVIRSSERNSWIVQIGKCGNELKRHFSDSKFAGKDLAFMAACFCAANKRIELGYHENHGRAI